MPSEDALPASTNAQDAHQVGWTIAQVRILRLALGTTLCLWFSQLAGWTLSFIAPILTLFLLALPLPALKLKQGVGFILVLCLCVYAGLALLPLLEHQPLVGALLLALGVFHSFYYTARGGSPLIGAFSTVGLALAAAVGTVSPQAAVAAANGLALGAVVGIVFVWIAFAALPDSLAAPQPTAPRKGGKPQRPARHHARRSALRSWVIVMPVLLFLLLSSASASYLAVMIKVSSMAQQASSDQTRKVAGSLIISTLIGGIGAVIIWQALSLWPSLMMYGLLIGLAGLLIGGRIFAGPAITATAPTWSYGYLTLLVVLAPAVMDGVTGAPAGAAFWSRLMMFIWATLYGVLAVYAFDALWPARSTDQDN